MLFRSPKGLFGTELSSVVGPFPLAAIREAMSDCQLACLVAVELNSVNY